MISLKPNLFALHNLWPPGALADTLVPKNRSAGVSNRHPRPDL